LSFLGPDPEKVWTKLVLIEAKIEANVAAQRENLKLAKTVVKAIEKKLG